MRRVAFLLVALIMALIFTGCGSPEQSVKMFLKYRVKGDIDAAKLYCTDGIDQRIDRGEFTVEQLGFGNPYGAPISWEGVRGKVNLNVQTEMGKEAIITNGLGPNKITFHLERKGGMWRIGDIETVTKVVPSPTDLGTMIEESEEFSEELLGDEENQEGEE